MMTSRRLRFVAPAAIALLVAACGAAASPSPSAAPSAAASVPASESPSESAAASVAESAAPSESATASAGASDLGSFPLPSFTSDKELEAVLPDQVGTETLQKLSFKGSDFLSQGSDSQEFNDLLGMVGKSPADFSIAVAAGQQVQIGVFRIAGVDGNTLLNAFVAAAQKNDSTVTVGDDNRGGKAVKKVVTDSSTTYAYAKNDFVFFVESDTPALVDEAFSKLP